MNLHEYQAKQLLAKYGLPTLKGVVCETLREVEMFFSKNNLGIWVLKCQVHAGGRGKAGGIKVVKSKKEALSFAEYWFGNRLITHQTDIKGQPVGKIFIEDYVDVKKELYFSLVIDQGISRVLCITSTLGGSDIEQISKSAPHSLYKVSLDPFIKSQDYQRRLLGFKLGLNDKQIKEFNKIFVGMESLFFDNDLTLAEINPLAITHDDNFICLDFKVDIDNNALFRHSKLLEMYDVTQENKREVYAKRLGLSYVSLKGNIGCMVNGAGLAMSTIDMIKLYGGEAANFLDIGGNINKERITEAFRIVVSDPKVKAILINIFGGIVCCDLVASGIVAALIDNKITIPVAIRLEGNNAKFGYDRLTSSNIINVHTFTDLTIAIQQAVIMAR
ncbi:ADP-forming succinate--CoA ligase subunit beta [Blochmannia endosymbiont of Colobopsis nipponica]|uniref:ADP-forming succinate--CoA ligase subunit beta n=1 Tax=Blochmannia endosymbiont of Colobopsis nipponica TaxID=2681987 RepID=UPI0017857312|nr:ADP-forming succinate--CoA ligase subunit beta [Blochmannia endosymbiont of Colobopsis nipponica]QOI11111.1 ADP-forming succinate--CoA ligase subunit beta [Blochmannia endosymbiont of Colobopsis nipponica]